MPCNWLKKTDQRCSSCLDPAGSHVEPGDEHTRRSSRWKVDRRAADSNLGGQCFDSKGREPPWKVEEKDAVSRFVKKKCLNRRVLIEHSMLGKWLNSPNFSNLPSSTYRSKSPIVRRLPKKLRASAHGLDDLTNFGSGEGPLNKVLKVKEGFGRFSRLFDSP